MIAAAVAIALLGNTLSQFSRSQPSTGSLVTFIGKAFGGYSAVVSPVPVYYRRYEPARFSPVTHVILPLLGPAAIANPLYELVKPGQPAPFSHYPLIALGVVVVALIYGAIVYARDRTPGERVGSIVADAD